MTGNQTDRTMANAVKRLGQSIAAAIVLLMLMAVPSLAAGRDYDCEAVSIGRLGALQTRAALANFVRCAEQHVSDVGWTQAEADFHNDPKWKDGAMYLFALDTDGYLIFSAGGLSAPGDANDSPDRVDEDGKMHRRRMVYTAGTFGSGFVTYRFGNPVTGESSPKVSYVMSVREPHGERSAILGAGFYPTAAPGTCSPNRVRAGLVYTRADVEQFVRCAELELKRRGLVALHDLGSNARWTSGPIYIFLLDRASHHAIVHPTLEGQDLGDLIDSTGFKFVEEMADIVEHYGDGYTYYEFTNPETGATEPKISYVRNVKIDGFDYILGAGLYVAADKACLDMPAARDVDTTPELELFVTCAAEMVASRGTGAFELLLNHSTWIEGSTYIFVVNQQCVSTVYPLEYRADANACSDVDADGTLFNQNIKDIANSEEGQGFTSYIWQNPATGEEERKTSYVVGVELDGEIVAVGAGLYGLEE